MASTSGCSCAPAGPVYSIPCPSAKCSPCFLPAVAVPVPIPGPQGPPGPPGQDELWYWATDISNNLAMLVPQSYPTATPERDQNSELVFPYQPVNQTSPGPQTRFIFDASRGALRAGHASGGQWDSALNRGVYSTALGFNNIARDAGTSALGGESNTVSGAFSTIAGGQSNQIQTPNAFIGGGGSNSIAVSGSGSFAVIAGGLDSTITADYTFIGGGQTNTIADTFSSIVGGSSNLVSGKYGFLGGGLGNSIAATALGYAVIGGGGGPSTGNRVNADYGSILGGRSNTVSGINGTVVGGQLNSAGQNAFVGGGTSGSASGTSSVVGGGASNRATGTTSTVGGGLNNVSSGTSSSVLGGEANSASGTRATVVGGGSNSAAADNSIAGGSGSQVRAGSTGGMALGANNTVMSNSGASFALGFSNTVSGGGTTTQSAIASGIVGGSNNLVGRSNWAFGFSNSMDVTSLEFTATGGRNSIQSAQYGIVSGYSNSFSSGSSSQSTSFPVIMGARNAVVAGDYAVVYGHENTVSVGGSSTNTPPIGAIAIGNGNSVQADYGVAIGKGASVLPTHTGAMVISTGTTVTSYSQDSFTSVFNGGYKLFSSNNLVNGQELASGQSSWSVLCSAETKDLLCRVDPDIGLKGIRNVPVHQFRYKADTGRTVHIGPTADDFHAAFSSLRPERNPKRIETLELDSALLLAVQALDKRLRALRRKSRKSKNKKKKAKTAIPMRE